MARHQVKTAPRPTAEGLKDYILDMIVELAKMSRDSGEPGIAIHLEAIAAAATLPRGGKALAG